MSDTHPKEGSTVGRLASDRASPPAELTPAALPKAPLDIQAYIGSRLREVYDNVANQPVPSRFLELMQQLDQK